ncbi:MAG: hypothetical protein ACREHD_13965, partial [Pirellulales bacterium]
SISDRMEDLLTSDVFGTMRYAGVECGFLDWLHTAAPMPFTADLSAIRDLIPAQNLRGVLLAFWPKLPNGREPDLILLFNYDGTAVLIVVEAKYLSGMSDFEAANQSDNVLTGNQIVDQVKPARNGSFGRSRRNDPAFSRKSVVNALVQSRNVGMNAVNEPGGVRYALTEGSHLSLQK